MVFNVSAALLFGVALVFMVRARMAPVGGSIVAFLFGFYAAASGLAPVVSDFVTSLAHALASLH
ncbi:hypothetical protein [Streptacidiphilus monticola]|uniref:DUF2304 domain-containing protein n=1 Tax=Streptacidiphilus monticola TaxID=2161674 RepID=A0ABW1FW11_9ACTN